MVSGQPYIRLLLSIGPFQKTSVSGLILILSQNSPNESVDFRSLHIPELLHRVLDLTLVRLDVNKENERVVLLDLLHRGLGVQRGHNCPVLIHARHMRDALARVAGSTGEAEGLRAVEGNGVADLARAVRISALECCLLCGLGLRRVF